MFTKIIYGVIVNQSSHKNNFKQHHFESFNIIKQIPPKSDIIICRDLLNHLKTNDVMHVLNNLKESKSSYLFISNNREWKNTELSVEIGGMSRNLNVELPPYDFDKAIMYNGHIGVWRNY